MDLFDKVKSEVGIAEVVTHFGVQLNSKDKGICPFHNDHHPSFSIKRSENIYKCFVCHTKAGDIIDFVVKLKGIKPYEAAVLIARKFYIDITDCKRQTANAAPKPSYALEPKSKADIVPYCKESIANAAKTTYFATRGLTAETVKRYCLGYDLKKQYIVIPYSSDLQYFIWRSVHGKRYQKIETAIAGSEPLYNIAALKTNTEKPIFVVESQICALTILQSGQLAVACGTTGVHRVVAAAREYKPKGVFVLSFDNRPDGEKASDELSRLMTAERIKHIVYNISANKKDPNELFLADREEFKILLSAAVEKANALLNKTEAADNVFVLCLPIVLSREAKDARFTLDINFSNGSCSVTETPLQVRQSVLSNYEENPVIKKIKELLGCTDSWQGTITELLSLSGLEVTSQNAISYGKLMTGFKDMLRADGILHLTSKNKNGRLHMFTVKK